jgi:hypothetical protein
VDLIRKAARSCPLFHPRQDRWDEHFEILFFGLATAKAFAESGAAVVLVDINESALRAATGRLTSAGHRAISVTWNVADERRPRPWSSARLPPSNRTRP